MVKSKINYNKLIFSNDNLFGNSRNLFSTKTSKTFLKPTGNIFSNVKNKRYPKNNLTFGSISKRYPFIDPLGDADRDGIANIFDCRPFNKYKHGGKSTAAWRKERKGFIVKAQEHFKGHKVKHNYRSKFILPSGRVISVGSYEHSNIEIPTGLGKQQFMEQTGAVAIGEETRRLDGRKSKSVTASNFTVASNIPVTERQKTVIRKYVDSTFKDRHLKPRAYVAYSIRARDDTQNKSRYYEPKHETEGALNEKKDIVPVIEDTQGGAGALKTLEELRRREELDKQYKDTPESDAFEARLKRLKDNNGRNE